MSLFALNNEFQRSIYRAWEDFSGDSRVQAQPGREAVESRKQESVLDLGKQREGLAQSRPRNAVELGMPSGPGFLQHDAQAWGRFLDSKSKG